MGQAEDHLVRAGLLRGDDHLLGVGLGQHPADVLGHGSVEKDNVLGEIADIAAEDVGIVLVEGRAVEADGTGGRMPDSGQHAGEGGLARGRGADDTERLSGPEPEAHHAQRGALLLGREDGDFLHVDDGARAGQGRRDDVGRGGRQQLLEVAPAAAGPLHQRPAADRLFHRRQRAAEQDRAGDHRAGRHLAFQCQIGAETKDSRLEEIAEGL